MPRPEELFSRVDTQGVAAIDQLIAERLPEELFLDFKGSSQSGAGSALNAEDAKNLSKAISGFGNAEGGC